jgi:hypothetical protein
MDAVRIHTTTPDTGTVVIQVPPELRGREVDIVVTASLPHVPSADIAGALRQALGLDDWAPALPRTAFDRDSVGGR